MPVVKKSIAPAVAAALQSGLNVRGTKTAVPPVKASKTAVKTVRRTAAKPVQEAPKAVPAKKVAPAKAAAAKAAQTTPAVLFTEDSALKNAETAVKRHLTANVADVFGDSHLTAKKAAIKNAAPFWGQATRNVVRNGNRIINRGEWLVALDFADDSPMGLVTALVKADGTVTHVLKADDAKLDAFVFQTA
jgi:hypothetical protein